MRVHVYGKLRSGPEYVGGLANDEQDFAEWLDHATGYACMEGKDRWQRGYETGAPHAFLFRSKERREKIVTGAIVPSQDSLERTYPLFLATTLREDTLGPGLPFLPVAGERFFLRGAESIREARTAASLAPATSALSVLEVPQRAQLDIASADFANWQTIRGQLPKLWEALFPSRGADAALRVLEGLVGAGHALRSSPPGERRYVRVPLGAGGVAATSFWLRLLASTMGGEHTIRIAAWSVETHGSLFVTVGTDPEPPIDFWLRLWLQEFQDARSIEASAMALSAGGETSLSRDFARVVRSKDASVGDLFGALES